MKTYIGDGVYADVVPHEVVLTTENGVSVTNRIVLGPREIVTLVELLERLVNTGAEQEER